MKKLKNKLKDFSRQLRLFFWTEALHTAEFEKKCGYEHRDLSIRFFRFKVYQNRKQQF